MYVCIIVIPVSEIPSGQLLQWSSTENMTASLGVTAQNSDNGIHMYNVYGTCTCTSNTHTKMKIQLRGNN